MADKTTIAPLYTADIWDDNLLIKAYDKSVNLAREELAKRIAISTNNQHKIETGKSVNSRAGIDGGKYAYIDPTIFQVGDYARATYSDGVDYEAKILDINQKSRTCLIKYIGYENEQEIRLCELVPSWGKRVRRIQFSKAKSEVRSGEDTFTRIEKKKSKIRLRTQANLDPQPPPMPPMPSIVGEIAHNSGHLSAMLMSWYLSGYYTGIYKGVELSKLKGDI